MTEITSTVEKEIIGGMPYAFRCRWYGYYDAEFNGISPVGLSKSTSDLTAYNGLSYSKEYFIRPNVTRYGNPTITNDCIVSGFSSSKYLTIGSYDLTSSPWQIIFCVKTGSSVSTQQYLFGSSTAYFNTVGGELMSSGAIGVGISSNGSSWDIGWMNGTTTLSTNTWYWIRISFTGSEYKLELSSNHGNTWNLENSITSSTPIYSGSTTANIHLGTMGDKTKVWGGSIDLTQCKILTASQYFPDVWTVAWEGGVLEGTILDFSNTKLPWKWGYEEELTTSRYAVGLQNQNYSFLSNILNGTPAGTLTISPNRKLGGFSSSNYLTALAQWNPEGNPWKIHLKITTNASTNADKYIIGQPSTNYTTPQLALNGSKLKLWLSSNKSSWNITSGSSCSIDLNTNSVYEVDLEFTGTAYTVSVDGVVGLTITTSTADYSGTYPLILGFDKGNTAFNGLIDLAESYIQINGVEVWRGFSKTILSGCINGDMDSNGEYYCYAINGDDHIELQKKTGGMIIAHNTTPRYLDEVDTNFYRYYRYPADIINTPV